MFGYFKTQSLNIFISPGAACTPVVALSQNRPADISKILGKISLQVGKPVDFSEVNFHAPESLAELLCLPKRPNYT